MSRIKQGSVTALAGLALLALASPSLAQIAVAPGGRAPIRTGVPDGYGGLAPLGPGGLGGYGLSTMAGNPYFGGGSLATSPYGGFGLSTMPIGGLPFTGQFIPPYALPYFDYGRMDPYSGYLQGLASVTSATGQYHMNIQQARITRYQANTAALDYAKKRIQHEAWLENQRYLSTQAVRERERTADLERAKDAPLSDVWSGKALNALFKSVVSKGSLSRGPNLPLEEDTLKHINLSAKSSSGNAGMLKDGGKLVWPAGLMDPMFKESREALSRKMVDAVEAIKSGKSPEAGVVKDINKYFREMERKLNDSPDDLPISQYLDAKRYLAQLRSAITALSDPATKNFLDNTWNAKGRTVAELVDHMKREGLMFNAASPGDEASYTSLYYSLRAFEAGLMAQR